MAERVGQFALRIMGRAAGAFGKRWQSRLLTSCGIRFRAGGYRASLPICGSTSHGGRATKDCATSLASIAEPSGGRHTTDTIEAQDLELEAAAVVKGVLAFI